MATFVEIKRRLDGSVARFECTLIYRELNHVVIRYDITGDERWVVAGVTLTGGTSTYAYYWTDRPYNVYHWVLPDGTTAGYYFNLSDQTQIGDGWVAWRDLVVDILVTPDGRCQVLDEDELPADLEVALQAYIAKAKSAVYNKRWQVIEEIETTTRRLSS